jgi:MFS transporter, DHA3 family, macrolide efflux protein
VLLGGIVVGLVLGLLNGGRLEHIGSVRLRWPALIFLAVLVRYGAEILLTRGFEPALAVQPVLLVGASLFLLAGLWANRRLPGMAIAFVGVASNAIVLAVNDGRMPIWAASLSAAGFSPADVSPAIHTILPASLDAGFVAHLGPFADVIPIPLPLIANVASIGDVVIAFGLAFFLFAIVQQTPESESSAEADSDLDERPLLRPTLGLAGAARLSPLAGPASTLPAGTGLIPGLSEASRLDRPLILGSAGISMSSPASATFPLSRPANLADRARMSPYGRLALNGPFATLWTGGLLSLFGDRVNQAVLAIFIYQQSHSPITTSLVFFVATVPNLAFGSFAGTLVDRVNQKRVLIVSDLLRAGIVFMLPLAAVTNILLVYPVVFLVTTVSIFFRPARESVIPRIVPGDDLMAANSATWMAEALADSVGYGLAGLLILMLGTSFTLAFWFDAATYIASAALIASVAIPPVVHRIEPALRTFRSDFLEGWQFLRNDPVLFANTLQGIAGQMAIGVMLPLSAIYAFTVIKGGSIPSTSIFAFLEGWIGVGNLIGGIAVGLIGLRVGKGRLVIAGYIGLGACVAFYSRTDFLPAAIAFMVGIGIANLIFVIPSQTLFQQRVPRDLMARVVSIRFSLVLGTMTLATGVSGFLASVFGVANVIGGFGVLACVAGVAGLFFPAVRDA